MIILTQRRKDAKGLSKNKLKIMAIRIYNTLSRKKELFKPLKPDRVRMYVCGPTVYDSCHIGHARSAVVFDVIVRYLKVKGFEVTYVRNFTDVDDKIINRASQLGLKTQEIADKYITEFQDDMKTLNVENATIEPRATEHIELIIIIIMKLIEKGFAYQIDGDVFYSVESFKEYGKLSGRSLNDMEPGARVDVDKRKKNPFDFSLWKPKKPGEPAWDSPWGKGRPGWHIECSAMSLQYLGETFDIHGGGKDLVFPHHENEIAQSEGAFGKPFVKYWIHNGFVNINHEKMSKSLGNFLLIRDVIKSFHPEAVRLFLLSKHYRSPIDFTDTAIGEAAAGLEKIYTSIGRVQKKIGNEKDITGEDSSDYWVRFCEAMDDDFNTARGIGIIFNAVRDMNRLLDKNEEKLSLETKKITMTAQTDIMKMCNILGILTEPPEVYFSKKRSKGLKKESLDPDEIEKMINDRAEARKIKDWDKADQIRKKLEDMNIVLKDSSEGTVWEVKNA